jgi:hypothetical protein
MRAFEFLFERSLAKNPSAGNNPSTVQAQIQSKIAKIFDIKELNKIFSYVSKIDLGKGFDEIFDRDPDLRAVQSTLARAIVDSPANVNDKLAFAKELTTNGIIDTSLLLNPGKTQNIQDLIVTTYPEIYQDIAPTLMSLAGKFQVKDKTLNRGKGEFFLALLSPEITIGGLGDITIGNKGFEVKDNEGRMYGSSSAYGKVEPGIKAATGLVAKFIATHDIPFDADKIKVTLGPKSNLYVSGPKFIEAGVEQAAAKQLILDCMTAIVSSLYPNISSEQLAGFHATADINGVVNWAQFKNYLKQFSYSYYQQESKFAGMLLFNSKKMTVTYVDSPEMFAQVVDINYGFYSSVQQGVQIYTP